MAWRNEAAKGHESVALTRMGLILAPIFAKTAQDGFVQVSGKHGLGVTMASAIS